MIMSATVGFLNPTRLSTWTHLLERLLFEKIQGLESPSCLLPGKPNECHPKKIRVGRCIDFLLEKNSPLKKGDISLFCGGKVSFQVKFHARQEVPTGPNPGWQSLLQATGCCTQQVLFLFVCKINLEGFR